jgi:hypothetical protein
MGSSYAGVIDIILIIFSLSHLIMNNHVVHRKFLSDAKILVSCCLIVREDTIFLIK